MSNQAINRVIYFTFNQAENWMQAYVEDKNGNRTVKQIIPSAFSTYLQTDGSGIGRLYGANLSAYVQAAPSREYVNQMIANFLTEAAKIESAPKMSNKDYFMHMREWENTHHLSYRHSKLK